MNHPRMDRCYTDKGNSPVIALSFTEFLKLILENPGDEWYWEKPGFESLGDAYDE